MRSRGLGLVEVIVSVAMLAVVSVGMMTFMRSAFKGQRTLASGADAVSYGDIVQQLLRNPDTCARSGLLGKRIDTTNPETASDPLEIHWPGATGPGDLLLAEGHDVDSTWRVTRLRLLSVVKLGATPVYFARLQYVLEDVKQSRMGAPKKVKDLTVNVRLDASSRIDQCYGEPPAQLGCVTVSAKPAGTVTVDQTVNIPAGVDPATAATGDPYSGGEDPWGAICNPGWLRTGCGVSELATPAGGVFTADLWTFSNGCQTDDEEISGANPTVYTVCCRNF